MKGVASSAPSLMTRRAPPCWHTKSLPSGENAIAVGLVSVLVSADSGKSVGRVAAWRTPDGAGAAGRWSHEAASAVMSDNTSVRRMLRMLTGGESRTQNMGALRS
jgi:hypothetical protein